MSVSSLLNNDYESLETEVSTLSENIPDSVVNIVKVVRATVYVDLPANSYVDVSFVDYVEDGYSILLTIPLKTSSAAYNIYNMCTTGSYACRYINETSSDISSYLARADILMIKEAFRETSS